jgi:hypothetical protein
MNWCLKVRRNWITLAWYLCFLLAKWCSITYCLLGMSAVVKGSYYHPVLCLSTWNTWLQLDRLFWNIISWTATKNCQHMPVLFKIANKKTFNMKTEHLSCSCCKCMISVARMHLGCWFLRWSMRAVILLLDSGVNFPWKKFSSHNWFELFF